MSDDVIVGYDGRARCAWAGAGDTANSHYHDKVWGTPTYDESAMFEAVTLGVFETGLSWSVVFGKRAGFREAFHNFNVAAVAAMTDQDVDRLVRDPSGGVQGATLGPWRVANSRQGIRNVVVSVAGSW
jgi:DNA-3-methyladenine glycosylase I